MADGDIPTISIVRRLRGDIQVSHEPDAGWRDDLRLFLIAWAAGFLFFMVLIA